MKKCATSWIVLSAWFCLVAVVPVGVVRADEISPPARVLPPHKGSVLDVTFTPDGKTLISSSRDSTIKVWDVATLELKRTLTNHTADVYSVAFTHDGALMASGSSDTRIILWETLDLLSLVLSSWSKLKLARLDNCLFMLEGYLIANAGVIG